MEKVKKVNIGGFVFTLDDNAYGIIREYLDMLEKHYQGKENGKEIIEGIEERLAELLSDHTAPGGIVTGNEAGICIGILGKPEEIYEDEDSPAADKPRKVKTGKKLFRDTEEKQIGGVCAGLGAFFNADPAFFRFGFFGLFLLSCFTANDWWNPALLTIIYCVLWICIPEAKTSLQKHAMRGENVSVDQIERDVNNRKSSGGSVFGTICRIFLICVGGFILFVGFMGLIGLFGGLLGLSIAGFTLSGMFAGMLPAALSGHHWVAILWKIAGALTLLLPMIGMIYGGMMLLFKFKSPKWRPGLCCFLLWIVAMLSFVTVSGTQFAKFLSTDKEIEKEEVFVSGETLHIRFEDLDRWKNSHMIASGDEEEYSVVFYRKEDSSRDSELEIAIYPTIILKETEDSTVTLRFKSLLVDKNEHEEDAVSIDPDTLRISPSVIRTGNNIGEIGTEIILFVPKGMNVSIQEPVEHHFDKEFEKSDLDINSKKVFKILSDIF